MKMKDNYGFRKCSEDYIQKKQEQYNHVASETQKIICQCGYEESEASFELVKKWILNNEQLSIIQGFGDAFRELFEYASTWIPIMVSFALGVLTTIMSGNTEALFSKNFWVCILMVVAVGFAGELALKTACIRTEKFSVRIIKEMTYGEYKLLLSHENNSKKEKSGKEDENV